HFSDRLTQTVGAGGAAVHQVVVQKAVTRFLVGEGEDVVYGPGRSGAGREIEFDVVFVLIEPGVEQERLELHANTSKKKLVSVTDSASWRRDDFLIRGWGRAEGLWCKGPSTPHLSSPARKMLRSRIAVQRKDWLLRDEVFLRAKKEAPVRMTEEKERQGKGTR